MYKGEITVPGDQLPSLLETASALKMKGKLPVYFLITT